LKQLDLSALSENGVDLLVTLVIAKLVNLTRHSAAFNRDSSRAFDQATRVRDKKQNEKRLGEWRARDATLGGL
jgi:hypothetical protein